MKRSINLFFYYFILILYLEFIYKYLIFRHINIGILFTFFFSLSIALLLFFVTKLFRKRKLQRNVSIIFTILLIIFFGANLVYYELLDTPFSISTLSIAGQAIDFYALGIEAIFKNILNILIMCIPLLILIFTNKFIDYSNRPRRLYKVFISFVIVLIISIISLLPFKQSGYKYYFKINNMLESIDNFGLITAQGLDIKRYIFGFEEEIVIQKIDENVEEKKQEIEYVQNQLDIDFNTLINTTSNEIEKNLYNYFNNETGTYQNEYTGYYKDKNLIFILAEGFNSIAVDPNLTPTLYKLTHTGFVFNNYYSPIFLSTTGGEFQATTGLIPTQEILDIWRKNNPTFNFALGNSFSKLGYNANAYHNWNYKYYKRHLTMPTLGFNSYTGCNNGLEKLMKCKWLPSDIDMINVTTPNYINEDKFLTYYISVSGHAPYNFMGGNSIAKKNKDLVKDLEYSTSVKAYLASQIEFDKALETLIKNLETAGKLDDTVIVITGDHYPYTLTNEEINELSDYNRDETFEVNRSNLIIWNNDDTVIKTVDKVGSQIDVLPTILNLFGVEYDSRMIIGNDILSNTPGLAIFNDRSWISDYGRYNATSKTFTSNNNGNITDDYVNNMNIRVENSFIVSKMVVETDIYKKVLGDK